MEAMIDACARNTNGLRDVFGKGGASSQTGFGPSDHRPVPQRYASRTGFIEAHDPPGTDENYDDDEDDDYNVRELLEIQKATADAQDRDRQKSLFLTPPPSGARRKRTASPGSSDGSDESPTKKR